MKPHTPPMPIPGSGSGGRERRAWALSLGLHVLILPVLTVLAWERPRHAPGSLPMWRPLNIRLAGEAVASPVASSFSPPSRSRSASLPPRADAAMSDSDLGSVLESPSGPDAAALAAVTGGMSTAAPGRLEAGTPASAALDSAQSGATPARPAAAAGLSRAVPAGGQMLAELAPQRGGGEGATSSASALAIASVAAGTLAAASAQRAQQSPSPPNASSAAATARSSDDASAATLRPPAGSGLVRAATASPARLSTVPATAEADPGTLPARPVRPGGTLATSAAALAAGPVAHGAAAKPEPGIPEQASAPARAVLAAGAVSRQEPGGAPGPAGKGPAERVAALDPGSGVAALSVAGAHYRLPSHPLGGHAATPVRAGGGELIQPGSDSLDVLAARDTRALAPAGELVRTDAVTALDPTALEGSPSSVVFRAALADDGASCFRYSGVLRRAGLEGQVALGVEVTREGRAVAVTIRKSSGHPRLDALALQQAEQCARFHVYNRRGQPVAARLDLPVRYRLETD